METWGSEVINEHPFGRHRTVFGILKYIRNFPVDYKVYKIIPPERYTWPLNRNKSTYKLPCITSRNLC